MRPERFCAPIHWGKQILLKIFGTVICNNSKSILFSFFLIYLPKNSSIWLCTLGHADKVNILVSGSLKEYKRRSHDVAFDTMLWSLVVFASSPCFLVKAIALLSNLKATIMLCFKIWIFLFVLKLFNILHSFLVTLVYWLQDKGKPLGLCSAQAIEVFKHQLVLVDSGISCLRRQRILLSTTTLRQLGDNLETTLIQLGDNFETTWRRVGDNLNTTL